MKTTCPARLNRTDHNCYTFYLWANFFGTFVVCKGSTIRSYYSYLRSAQGQFPLDIDLQFIYQKKYCVYPSLQINFFVSATRLAVISVAGGCSVLSPWDNTTRGGFVTTSSPAMSVPWGSEPWIWWRDTWILSMWRITLCESERWTVKVNRHNGFYVNFSCFHL